MSPHSAYMSWSGSVEMWRCRRERADHCAIYCWCDGAGWHLGQWKYTRLVNIRDKSVSVSQPLPPNESKQDVRCRIRSGNNLANYKLEQPAYIGCTGRPTNSCFLQRWQHLKGDKLAEQQFRIYCQEAVRQSNTLANKVRGRTPECHFDLFVRRKVQQQWSQVVLNFALLFVATLTWGNLQHFILLFHSRVQYFSIHCNGSLKSH